MSDNPNEGKPQTEGTAAANQPVSQGSGTPLSGDFTSLAKELSEIKSQLRSLQSGKDKAVDRIEERLAKYLGVEEDKVMDAQRRMALDDLLDERLQGAQQASGRANVPQANDEVQTVINELGLDANNPQVLSVLTKKLSPVRTAIELAKLAQPSSAPTDAQRPPVQGVPPTTPNQEALVAEYRAKVLANRGKRDVILALRAEYKQKGVPVESISFSI